MSRIRDRKPLSFDEYRNSNFLKLRSHGRYRRTSWRMMITLIDHIAIDTTGSEYHWISITASFIIAIIIPLLSHIVQKLQFPPKRLLRAARSASSKKMLTRLGVNPPRLLAGNSLSFRPRPEHHLGGPDSSAEPPLAATHSRRGNDAEQAPL